MLRDLAGVSDTSGLELLLLDVRAGKVCGAGTSWHSLNISTLLASYSLASEHEQPVLISSPLPAQVPAPVLGVNILSNDMAK